MSEIRRVIIGDPFGTCRRTVEWLSENRGVTIGDPWSSHRRPVWCLSGIRRVIIGDPWSAYRRPLEGRTSLSLLRTPSVPFVSPRDPFHVARAARPPFSRATLFEGGEFADGNMLDFRNAHDLSLAGISVSGAGGARDWRAPPEGRLLGDVGAMDESIAMTLFDAAGGRAVGEGTRVQRARVCRSSPLG